MPLSPAQRLDRLKVRLADLACWRERAYHPLSDWSFEGVALALHQPWPRKDGVVHMACIAEVPSDWPLAETRLRLDLGGEGLVHLKGRTEPALTFGVDPNHREFPVPASWFAIEAEATARLPFGEPVASPSLDMAELIWLDPEVDRLLLLLRQVTEAIETLAGHDVVPHLIEAGEAALRNLDWPSSTADYVARTARQPMQQKIWQLPSLKPSPEALNDAQRSSVRQAYDELMAQLRALRERFPPQGKVALTGHAHIDLAWLWPYDETRRKLRRSFHTALRLMDQSPEFRFDQSTAHYYHQLAEDDPTLLEAIVHKAKAGQWEVLGGTWVEPDTILPTGESLSRQILYGQRFFERVFGCRHRICWLPDCFGFSGALPQLLQQGGIDSFFTIKVNWSESNRFPSDLFWWEGLDGSRVLAHTFDNPVDGYNGALRPDSILNTWRNFRQKDRHDTTLLCVGHGDGGGGVTPEMLQREEQLRAFPALPEARWTRVDDFFTAAHASATHRSMPVWHGEIYLELHRGTLTSQSMVKRKHRRAERALITAETVASLAHLLGAARASAPEDLWRIVLKNEFHDILPGSSINEVYRDAERELDAAIAGATDLQETALQALVERLPGGSDGAVLVVNPSLHPRRLTFANPIGQGTAGTVAAATNIAPLTVAIVPAAALAPEAGLVADTHRLENAHLKVTLAEDGTIANLIHKPSGREAIDGIGNRLVAYTSDKPRNWDAWDVEEDYREKGEDITAVHSIALVETGPHRAAIRIERRWRHSVIVQTLSLCANARRLDIHTDIDWHDRRVLLRTETGVAVRNGRATAECAYGVVDRPALPNTSWDHAMFEAPAHRFLDLSEPGFGVALLNDAKYGHSIEGNVLGLSLLRSPIYPDPLADEGFQSFTYALYPHEGAWHEGGVREEAEDLNQPLIARAVANKAAGTWTPLGVRGIPAALSALKPSEDGNDLILRVYEPAGRRGDFATVLPAGFVNHGPVTILEEPMADQANEGLKPFQVKSWRIGRG